MHKRLTEEGFNRRYVLLPLLASIALVVLGFSVTEARRSQTLELADLLRERQDVIRLLTETTSKAMEAESAQRGFLLTGEAKYLAPLEMGLVDARARLDELMLRYQKLAPEEVKVLQQVVEDLRIKAQEMRQSVALLKQGKPREALALVKSDLGLYQMFAISTSLESLRGRERERVLAGLNQWGEALRVNTIINVCGMVFTIGVLIILGLLVTRDIRRREGFATDLAAQIDARTAELRDLSRHMSRVAEAEKHALARELHDELGGLLVAMRMDISQIRKRLGPMTDPDLQARWERVEQALSAGVELKRRVIEDLRPTLLDNMGLFTALRWLAQQRCEQAKLYLRMDGLDEDIEVPPETAIAVFRTTQEAIANVVKHSGARRIILTAKVNEKLTVTIADDGHGLPPGSETKVGSHGLKQMRFRMESVGGTLSFESNEVGGTTVVLSAAL
ncbi:MAG TPA: CHASE3 domain-containing protein [Steroidobacteraceae bacterium]|nr:CHASE3 domain-containing protein [Steroidobacteraceae bacterium]